MNATHLVVFFGWEELQPIAVYSHSVDRREVSACQQQRLENVSRLHGGTLLKFQHEVLL